MVHSEPAPKIAETRTRSQHSAGLPRRIFAPATRRLRARARLRAVGAVRGHSHLIGARLLGRPRLWPSRSSRRCSSRDRTDPRPVIESRAPMQRTPAAASSPGARGRKPRRRRPPLPTPAPSATSGSSASGTGAGIAVDRRPERYRRVLGARACAAARGVHHAGQHPPEPAGDIGPGSQLTVRDGGYVQSSNVQVQQQGASEATLALRLPSSRLAAALAAIGRSGSGSRGEPVAARTSPVPTTARTSS